MTEAFRELVLRACRIGAVVLTTASFWYVPGFLFAEGYSKLPFFVFGVCALVGGAVLLPKQSSVADPVARLVRLSWLVFGGILGLVSLLGVSPWDSLFGSQVRQSGVWVWAHVALLVWLLPGFLRRPADWQWVWGLHGALGMVAAVTVLFGERTGAGSSAWFGNPLLFVAVLVAAGASVGLVSALLPRHWVPVAGLGFLVLVTAMFTTGSRSGVFGMLVGLGVALTVVGFSRIRSWRHVGWVIVVGGLGGVLFWVARVFLLTYQIPGLPLSRFLQPVLESGSASPRTAAWGIAWRGFLDRSLFGWGPEQFAYVFDRYYEPSFFAFSLRENFWDKPHNLFIEWLVAGGVPLFLAGVVLLGVLMWGFLTHARRGKIPKLAAAAGVGGIVALCFFFTFVFETFVAWMFLALASAYLVASGSGAAGGSGKEDAHLAITPPSNRWRRGALLTALVFLLGMNVYVFGVGSLANILAARVVRHTDSAARASIPAVAERSIDQAVRSFQLMRRLPHPYTAELSRHLTLDFLNQEADGRYPSGTGARMLPLFLEAVRTDRDEAPDRFERQFVLGQAAARAVELGDAGMEPLARQALDAALQISPGRQPVLLLAARLDMQRGDFASAIARVQAVVDSVPTYAHPRYFLVLAYLAAGDEERAATELLAYLDRGGYSVSLPEVVVFARALLLIGEADRAFSLYAALVQSPPYAQDVRDAYITAAQEIKGMTAAEARASLRDLLGPLGVAF